MNENELQAKEVGVEALALVIKSMELMHDILLKFVDKADRTQDLICDCYCKFPEEYHAMYEDTDVAMENLDREKCNYCPLMNL